MDQIHGSRIGEQKLVSTPTQVLPEFESKVPQSVLDPLVERLLEVAPGLALLVLPVTVVTGAMHLVGTFHAGVSVV
jgi:hypothetical protein